MPLSIAYTIWLGMGTLGPNIVCIIYYKEPKNILYSL
ncbi:SMR family transporter [Staphylococcus pseudoxylosus]